MKTGTKVKISNHHSPYINNRCGYIIGNYGLYGAIVSLPRTSYRCNDRTFYAAVDDSLIVVVNKSLLVPNSEYTKLHINIYDFEFSCDHNVNLTCLPRNQMIDEIIKYIDNTYPSDFSDFNFWNSQHDTTIGIVYHHLKNK